MKSTSPNLDSVVSTRTQSVCSVDLSHQVVVVSMSSHYSIMMCKSEIDFTEFLDSVVSTRTQSVCSVDLSHQA